jgi:hypothetical protein
MISQFDYSGLPENCQFSILENKQYVNVTVLWFSNSSFNNLFLQQTYYLTQFGDESVLLKDAWFHT